MQIREGSARGKTGNSKEFSTVLSPSTLFLSCLIELDCKCIMQITVHSTLSYGISYIV